MNGRSPVALPAAPDDRLDRRLVWALAISLAAHGLVLAPTPSAPPVDGGASLQATLRPPSPARTTATPATPAPAKPVLPARRLPLPEAAERIHEKRPATLPAPPPASAPGSGGTLPAAAPGTPANGAAAPAPDVAAIQPPLGIDANGRRQYRLDLGRMAARFKRYPPRAREAGWEGQVALRVAVSEAGIPAGLVLVGSSGFPVLDEAALEMTRRAAGQTPVPESLRGRAFTIDLAVDYSLRDEP